MVNFTASYEDCGMKKKTQSEHLEQREFVKWFRQNISGVLIFAIPNGGKRNMAEALRLKVEGVVRGIPDLFIPEYRTFIEMKKSDGTMSDLSPDQVKIKKHLEGIGYTVLVGFGCEDAKKKLLLTL